MVRFARNKRGRPLKSEQPSDRVAGALRHAIIGGAFPPGARLPSCATLMARYRVTSNTLNAVIHVLVVEGFLRTERRAGIYVSETPPHLSRYGLVFRGFPAGQIPEYWSNYWAILEHEARALCRAGTRSVVSYYNVAQHPDADDYRRLQADIGRGRLAGLFLVHPYGGAFGGAYAGFRGPVVSVGSYVPPRAVALDNDMRGFIRKAVAYLAAQGRRRVAWIGERQHEELRRACRDLKAGGRPARRLFPEDMAIVLNSASRETARPLTRLLMRQEPAYRPDAILIMDDHFVEPACRGLEDARAVVPRDVEIMAHCNFPAVPKVDLPVRWLGFDAAEMVRRAIGILEDQLNNRPNTDDGLVAARWEAEWRQARPDGPERKG